MLAKGDSYSVIEATVPCYREYINRWRRRFLDDRLEGLRPRYRGQPPTVLTPTMEARVLAKTGQAPPDGSTTWSTRKLGRLLKIHHNLVAKAWQRAGLQPHRFERDMQSDDPDFETKAADVIGLYINPPDHAAVFAVDDKTAIQALDCLDPVLPLSPGAPSATVFSTIGTARSRCWRRSTRSLARSSGRPSPGIPVRPLSNSWAT